MPSLSGLTICLAEGQGELFQRFHSKSYDWVVLLQPASMMLQICSLRCPGTLSLRCVLCSRGPSMCPTQGWDAETKLGAYSAAGQLDTERNFRMVSNPSWYRPQPQRVRGCLVQSPGVLVVQSLSCTRCFATPPTVACQAPLSSTIFQSLLRFMSTELMMPSNHLILCRPPPLAFSLSQCQSLFQRVSTSHLVTRW